MTDPVFRGKYHGKRKHEGKPVIFFFVKKKLDPDYLDDMKDVFERSKAAGLRSFILTGGSLSESSHAISLAKEHKLFCTAGCHPTRSAQFDKHPGGAEVYLKELDELIGKNIRASGTEGRRVIVAIGECGLGKASFV